MKVGAVVLHYRHWPDVQETMHSLLAQTRPPDVVLVVDNHSNDGSIVALRAAYPQLEIVEAPVNRGYAAGMNIGIREMLNLGADAILLLTHECRLAASALEALAARLDSNGDVGAVGPLLGDLGDPDRVFSAGGTIDPRTWRTSHVRDPSSLMEWSSRPARAADWLDGAAILLRSDVVLAAGLMDENYFLYFEETEYMVRIRACGWAVECVPAAVAWQASAGKPSYLWTRNRLRFLARNAPRRALALEAARSMRALIRESARARTNVELAEVGAQWSAVHHALLGKWGPEPQRTGRSRR
jgi:GT2 family glycosyltransferase